MTCGWCKKQIPDNAPACDCKWRKQKFERFCISCKESIPLKANQCPFCNVIQFSKTEFLHVRCGSCKGRNITAWEIDDLFIALNCPLIFRTKKFVKIRWFKDRAVGAARVYIKYFHKSHKGTTPEIMRQQLLTSDEEPWRFPTVQHAVAFLNNFPCNKCGKKNWKHDVVEDVVAGTKKAAAAATPYAVPFGLWVWGFVVGATTVLYKFTQSTWKFFTTNPKEVQKSPPKKQEDEEEDDNKQRGRNGGNKRRKGGKK